MSLIDNATNLHSRLLSLPHRFGIPSFQNVVTVTRKVVNPGQILPTITTTNIEPNPSVEPVSPRLVGTFISENIVISIDDVKVTNINGSYTSFELTGDWSINGKSGYQCLSARRLTTTWEVILRAPVDKR